MARIDSFEVERLDSGDVLLTLGKSDGYGTFSATFSGELSPEGARVMARSLRKFASEQEPKLAKSA
jgi:hypothetical protein